MSVKLAGLVQSIVPAGQPILLPFTNLGSENRARHCQLNCSRQAKMHGGARVDGWMLWENNLFAEAEAHSVWQNPNGDLVDLTPRPDGEPLVLFLPDPDARTLRATVNGKDVDRLLANRTTLPEAPYTTNGGFTVLSEPYYDYAYPSGGRAQMSELWGVDTAASL